MMNRNLNEDRATLKATNTLANCKKKKSILQINTELFRKKIEYNSFLLLF